MGVNDTDTNGTTSRTSTYDIPCAKMASQALFHPHSGPAGNDVGPEIRTRRTSTVRTDGGAPKAPAKEEKTTKKPQSASQSKLKEDLAAFNGKVSNLSSAVDPILKMDIGPEGSGHNNHDDYGAVELFVNGPTAAVPLWKEAAVEGKGGSGGGGGGGGKENHMMDDCLRWRLLRDLIKREEKGTPLELVKMILRRRPYLAFECPYDDNRKMDPQYTEECTFQKDHEDLALDTETTPLHEAAKSGRAGFVRVMIVHGRTFCQNGPPSKVKMGRRKLLDPPESGLRYQPLAKILQQRDPGTTDGDRPLMLAVKARGRKRETVAELLKELSEEGAMRDVDPVDDPFGHIIDKSTHDGPGLVREFLQHPKLVKRYVTSRYIIRALEKLPKDIATAAGTTTLQKDDGAKPPPQPLQPPQNHALQIVKELAGKAEAIDRSVAERIIERGLKEAVWDKIPNTSAKLETGLTSYLLHLAVRHQQLGFVELFLNEYPESIEMKYQLEPAPEAQYPLWYNNHFNGKPIDDKMRDETTRVSIRTVILDQMTRKVNEISKLMDILYDSNEVVGDLCFDASRFNFASDRIADFVSGLIRQSRRQKLLRYEKTLHSAEFPPLDMMVEEREHFTENEHLKQEHDEVFRVLGWLHVNQKVKTIIKLKVPDRLVNPHDDAGIAQWVKNLNVEQLDWKVLDLPITSFIEDTKERLTQLHLYSSGNRAVIQHWFGSEGIGTLKNLEKLHITIVQETCTVERYKALRREINILKGDFLDARKEQGITSKDLKIYLGLDSWYPTPKLADLTQIALRVAPQLADIAWQLGNWVDGMKRDKTFRPTKVAILDNGILSIPHHRGEVDVREQDKPKESDAESCRDSLDETDHPDDERSLWTRIKRGQSFVDRDSMISPWLFASDPHGTQMANLICALDPFCDLYIARVAEDSTGITRKRVAQAIQWATTLDVDIISMSFTIEEEDADEGIKQAIDAASKKGIIMTCSTHDEGARIKTAWPADYKATGRSIIALAASDEFGRILREDPSANYDYLIRGREVPVGVIPFLKSKDKITGSSVATAIAAGLSSFIITCDRIAYPGSDFDDGVSTELTRFQLVKSHLDQMQAKKDSHFVDLKNVQPIKDTLAGKGARDGAKNASQAAKMAKPPLGPNSWFNYPST